MRKTLTGKKKERSHREVTTCFYISSFISYPRTTCAGLGELVKPDSAGHSHARGQACEANLHELLGSDEAVVVPAACHGLGEEDAGCVDGLPHLGENEGGKRNVIIQ